MAKLGIISDLHGYQYKSGRFYFDYLEDNKFELFKNNEYVDILIIAGDLASVYDYYNESLNFIKQFEGKHYGKLFIIKGNHDFYVKSFFNPHIKDYTSPQEIEKNSHVLIDNDICIVGCPLFSPISVKNEFTIFRGMNDYNFIPDWTVPNNNIVFQKYLNWLTITVDQVRADGHNKVVVVTHHLPLEGLIDEKYIGHSLNEAFCLMDSIDNRKYVEQMRNFLDKNKDIIKLFVHGHSHQFLDKISDNGIRFVRNPFAKDQIFYNNEICKPQLLMVEI